MDQGIEPAHGLEQGRQAVDRRMAERQMRAFVGQDHGPFVRPEPRLEIGRDDDSRPDDADQGRADAGVGGARQVRVLGIGRDLSEPGERAALADDQQDQRGGQAGQPQPEQDLSQVEPGVRHGVVRHGRGRDEPLRQVDHRIGRRSGRGDEHGAGRKQARQHGRGDDQPQGVGQPRAELRAGRTAKRQHREDRGGAGQVGESEMEEQVIYHGRAFR